MPFAHRLRRPSRATIVAAARAFRSWSRQPRGRLVLPAVLALLVLGGSVTAGAWAVPAALGTVDSPPASAAPVTSAPAPVPTTASAAPGLGEPPLTGLPTGLPGVSTAPTVGGRPADALAAWAGQVAARTSIPAVAVQAYGYAELVAARTMPGCKLSWTTLAAIGKVESAHGHANGANLGADGQALPPIRGLPLDGQGGRMLIVDSDRGLLDGDQRYDVAMGPMQFIPTTWREMAVDADGNGVTDPNDVDDAALAAANYLCRAGRDMSTSEDWWSAILSYNDVRRYARDVFAAANQYGTLSRT